MNNLYNVRPSPGQGLGCFATALIPSGTLILSETPLFNVREPRTNLAVTTAFSKLSSSKQEQYLELYAQDPTATGDTKVVDIFNSNAWQTGSRTSICPLAARFNHACVPNASFAWNSRLCQITVHTTVAIPANTQIYLSYEHMVLCAPVQHAVVEPQRATFEEHAWRNWMHEFGSNEGNYGDHQHQWQLWSW
jgi:hypothetical protein